MPNQPLPKHSAIEARMADIKPPYRPTEALIEANRCLFCYDAPCIMACPTGIDIPTFIKRIANGNQTGAAKTILAANILGASCARVCPTEVLCEGACVVLDREGDPVKIGRLQRYATDSVAGRASAFLPKSLPSTGKRVAVVGAGPAGLGCATELARLGHQVVVFERAEQAGGLNTYGIAYYKMKPVISLEEVDLVRSLGVEIRCGVEVGKDVSASKLESEFDAIFLGVGLGDGTKLRIPGENLPGVRDALDFIREIHTKPLHEVAVGSNVAVIGCGNTAIDAATQARRLSAGRVIVIYRRSESDMSAYGFEYKLAQADGAQFIFNTMPVEVINEGGRVAGLKLVKTRNAPGGRAEPLPGTEFTMPFDLVLKAVGQEKQGTTFASLFSGLVIDSRGVVQRDPLTGATSMPKIFAGGDCGNGGREVVNAVGEGKKAARGIHAFLSGETTSGPVQPSRLGAKDGAQGSGLRAPVRAHELEAQLME
jgi:dihydropyrimidine dehydrogenase (NAD+) subunit PreT